MFNLTLPPRRGETDSTRNVIVSEEDFLEYAAVYSNARFVQELLTLICPRDTNEFAREAWLSYSVDYYIYEVNNGGFLQLLFNTCWHANTIADIREGLVALDAKEHLELFDQVAASIEKDGPSGIEHLLNETAMSLSELLEPYCKRFYQLNEEGSDLSDLNTEWLMALPNLQVRTREEIDAELARRKIAVPDLAQRLTEAQAGPRHKKLLEALAGKAGHHNAEETVYTATLNAAGQKVPAWNFSTDLGKFYMIESERKATMFRRDDHAQVAEIDL